MERVELLSNAPRRLEVEAGTTIRVEHGRIWLTLTNLAQDIVLPAGQAFCAPHAGRVVVEAWDGRLSPAAIVINRPTLQDGSVKGSKHAHCDGEIA